MTTPDYPWHLIHLDRAALIACVTRCKAVGVKYGLGNKAPSLSSEPGRDFKAIDCSGFVRWAIYQASSHAVQFPDGSVVQHDWVTAQNFKISDVESGTLHDNRVRIAFLSPAAGGGVGHVALILNGTTLESHGGIGPDRRAWTGEGWQAKTSVYVLTDANVG